MELNSNDRRRLGLHHGIPSRMTLPHTPHLLSREFESERCTAIISLNGVGTFPFWGLLDKHLPRAIHASVAILFDSWCIEIGEGLIVFGTVLTIHDSRASTGVVPPIVPPDGSVRSQGLERRIRAWSAFQ